MDQGTQEKVDRRDINFVADSAIICKGCKSPHIIATLHTDEVRFPNGDLSVISVYCYEELRFYDYTFEELRPYGTQAASKTDDKIDKLIQRVATLEKLIGKSSGDDKTTLYERIQKTESLLTDIAEQILGSKPKQTPKGQVT